MRNKYRDLIRRRVARGEILALSRSFLRISRIVLSTALGGRAARPLVGTVIPTYRCDNACPKCAKRGGRSAALDGRRLATVVRSPEYGAVLDEAGRCRARHWNCHAEPSLLLCPFTAAGAALAPILGALRRAPAACGRTAVSGAPRQRGRSGGAPVTLPHSWHRLAWRAALSNMRCLPFPHKLTFAVTDRCNACCEICRIWRQEPRPEMSAAEIREFFAHSNRFSWVDLTGGEILLREDVPEIAAAILASCRDLSILHFPTNGLLPDLTVDLAGRILALRPPSLVVTVSLNGPPRSMTACAALRVPSGARSRPSRGCAPSPARASTSA